MKILNASIAVVCSAAATLLFVQCRRDSISPISTNKAPVANAKDLVINLPQDSVELDGSGSIDPDGDPITYKWTYINGPNNPIIRENTKAKTVVAGFKDTGMYTFLLTVIDSKGAYGKDTAVVRVNQAGTNRPPVVNVGIPQTITLPKDSIELDGSRSTDPDGDPITYKWSCISGPNGFVIREDSKAKTVVANLKEKGNYIFRLTVTDARSASASADVIITVKPAQEASPIVITLSPASQMVKIPIGVNPILEASAVSSGVSIVSYSWSNESRPIGTAAPTITTPNNAYTTVTGIDNAVAGTYTFKVTVKDASGNIGTAIASITTSNVEPKIIGSFVGHYSGDNRNTFRFNITPDTANTTVDIVVGGSTSYDNNKTKYTYMPGISGAVDTLKSCSFKITAPDGSISTTSFMGLFSKDYKTLTIKDFKFSAGLTTLSDFELTRL